MNAVEIEEAVSRLAEAPFDPVSFPFAFLEAFGNKETTIKRLQAEGKATSNQSDIGGVLQRNNIHLKVCAEGQVTATLAALPALRPLTVRVWGAVEVLEELVSAAPWAQARTGTASARAAVSREGAKRAAAGDIAAQE